jgi:hypothetical protein
MLIKAASRMKKKTRTLRMTMAISSYRTGNQIRLPKQRLYIGHATVGIHVRRTMKDTTPMQIAAFHRPRGANRSYLKARRAISIPKTRVIYPMRKIAMVVSHDSPFENRTRRTYQGM